MNSKNELIEKYVFIAKDLELKPKEIIIMEYLYLYDHSKDLKRKYNNKKIKNELLTKEINRLKNKIKGLEEYNENQQKLINEMEGNND